MARQEKMSEMGYAGDPSNYDKVKINEHIEDITQRYVNAIMAKRGSV